MKISVVSAAFPPDLDGIGDYTLRLAKALVERADVSMPVTVYTRSGKHQEVSSVEIIPFFKFARPSTFRKLVPLVTQDKPDWVLVQYNPFCWGRRGFCPAVPKTLRAVRNLPHAPKICVMFHELFTEDAGWKNKLMRAWQRVFALQVAQAADLRITSCQAYADWLGERGLLASALPVGSNLPDVPGTPNDGAETLYFGTFGSPHASRRIGLVAAAVAAVREQGIDARFVFVGSGGEIAKSAFQEAGIPFRATGVVNPTDAAEEIAKLDVFLSPFSDGLSARRASAIAALQAGVPLVSTAGHRTDPFLLRENGKGLFLAGTDEEFVARASLLANDLRLRERIGATGREFYQQVLDWPVISEQLAGMLSAHNENRAN